MIDRIAAQAASLALAALVTVSALVGMDSIATQSYDTAQFEAAPVQQVVVVGQRLPRA